MDSMNSMNNMGSSHMYVDSSVESPLAMEGFQADHEREQEREQECSFDNGNARRGTPDARSPSARTPNATKSSHHKIARSKYNGL